MNAYQHRLFLHRDRTGDFHAHAADAESQVRLEIDKRCVGNQVEITQARGQLDREFAVNEPLAAVAELDEIFDCAHFDCVPLTKLAHASGRCLPCGPSGPHDLANDLAASLEAGKARQVDASLGVAGTDQDAPFASPQAVDMAVPAH